MQLYDLVRLLIMSSLSAFCACFLNIYSIDLKCYNIVLFYRFNC